MRNISTRLERMETEIAPQQALDVFVWAGTDVDAAVASARSTNHWADDGRHPVKVTRFSWKANGTARHE